MNAKLNGVEDTIAATPARTLGGLIAKARFVEAADSGIGDVLDSPVAASLVKDLLSLNAAAPTDRAAAA